MAKGDTDGSEGPGKGKQRNFKLTDATVDKIKAIADRRTVETGIDHTMTDAVKYVVDVFISGGRAGAPVMLPHYGDVPCGTPIDLESPASELHDVLSPMLRGEGRFLLTAKGDSMNRRKIAEGDKLVVQRQKAAESGQIVVATVDNKATLKVFKVDGRKFYLDPDSDNPIHKRIDFRPGVDEILGVVVSVVRKC